MRLISKLLFSFFSNLIALLLAAQFIVGFETTGDLASISAAAAIFTLLNLFLGPIVKLLLSPLIVLTFGLFSLVINAGILYLLDFLSVDVTIAGAEPLIYGTLVITLVNVVIHFSAKSLYRY